MRDYFHRRYSPGNIVLARQRAGSISRHWSLTAEPLLRRLGAVGRRGATVPPAASPRRLRVPAQGVGHAGIRRAIGPGGRTPTIADRFAAKILATILGDDSGSRLYWELVDPGLAEQAA